MDTSTLKRGKFSQVASFRVEDDDSLSDVSLISKGVASGHGLEIDDESLATALESLKGKKKLRSYLHHSMWEDRLGAEIGYFSGFRVEDDRLMADKFTFLKSFKNNKKEQYDALVELAKEMPEEFGVSLSFSFETEKSDSMPAVRFKEVFSADFVDQPAANPRGLFRIEDNNSNHNVNTDMAKEDNNQSELLELRKQVVALESERDGLREKVTNKENELGAVEERLKAELSDERSRVKNILELGREHGKQEVALKAIEEGKTIEQFKADLLDSYREGNQQTTETASFEINPDREPKSKEEFHATHTELKKKDNATSTAYFEKYWKRWAR